MSGPRLAVYSVVQAARLFCVSEGFFAQSIKNRTAAAGRGAMCVFVCLFVSLVGGVRAAGVEPAARLVVGGGGAAAECAAAASGARGETTSTLRRWRGLSERGGAGELGSGVYACAGGARADAAVRGPTNKRWVGPQCRRGREGHIASVRRWGGGEEGRSLGEGQKDPPERWAARVGEGSAGGGWGWLGCEGRRDVEGRTHPCACEARRGNPARAGAWERARGGVEAGKRKRGLGVGRTPPRARGRRTHSARAAGAPTATPEEGWRCGATARAERVGCLIKRIFGTKAEPQRIVATRPLCRVQHPVPHSSRLQGIHRGGPVTCDRVRLRPKLGVLAAERPSR